MEQDPGITSKKRRTLILEGNIGAGKSTFLKMLQKLLDVDVVFEPTDKWQNIGTGGNLLDMFYKDTSRWAYTFQSYAFISRVQAQLEREKILSNHSVQIFERSVYCDRFCFAKNCFESGDMSELEWEIYKEWFSWLVERYTKKPEGFIYLQASPEVCFKRLQKRNRSEESEVPLAYLKSLHQKHEDWLVSKKEVTDYLLDIPVLILNCDQEFESDSLVQVKLAEEIKSFINKISVENVGIGINQSKVNTLSDRTVSV